MFRKTILLSFVTLFSLAIAALSHDHQLCPGIMEENDLRIPISIKQNGGITESDFNNVLDQVQKFYGPEVANMGGRLVINRLWSSSTVNASANRSGNDYVINMYGGLARHPAITKDGFMLVACHEMGHHIGGAPKLPWFGWASNEGQSDYFANLKCLRQLFSDSDNAQFVATENIDAKVRSDCEANFQTQAEENQCMRAAMAGLSVANLFRAGRRESAAPKFETPDPNRVRETMDDHPATQCRLDTYFQGSLCIKDRNEGLDDDNAAVGTCEYGQNFQTGLRPLCWYKP